MRRTLVIVACGLAVPATASAAGQAIPAENVRTIEVHAISGKVWIEHHDHPTVQILNESGVTVTQTKTRIVLRSTNGGISARVPSAWLEIRCQSGDIEIRGPHTRIDAHTASGRIRFEGSAEELEVRSLSGRVVLEGRAERVRAESVAGDVRVKLEGTKSLRVKATNGDVTVQTKEDLAERIEIETINGDIDVEGRLLENAELRAQTMSGRIRFKRLNDQGYRLEAKAKYGKLAIGDDKRSVQDTVVEQIGDGRADVRLTTFSGRIAIE